MSVDVTVDKEKETEKPELMSDALEGLQGRGSLGQEAITRKTENVPEREAQGGMEMLT